MSGRGMSSGGVEIGRCVPCSLGESLINTRVVWRFVTGCRGVGKKKEEEKEREKKEKEGRKARTRGIGNGVSRKE